MYGMVHKAVKARVVTTHGASVWHAIKQRAGIVDDVFISNEGYPEDIAYRLVNAASEVLQLPAARIFHAFREHWVLNTARQGYEHMMRAGGRTLGESLANLPSFQDGVALPYPKLVPPQFEVTDRKDNSLRLHYITHRPRPDGLRGRLDRRLGKNIRPLARWTLDTAKIQGGDRDIILIAW